VSAGDDPLRGLPDDRAWSHDLYGAAVRAKHADRACPACGSSSWEVGEDLFLMPALDPAGRLVNGRGVEVVLVYCTDCGFLRPHAAGQLLGGLPRPADTGGRRRFLPRILTRDRAQDLDHGARGGRAGGRARGRSEDRSKR
jgi:hypothetical protein